jgi:hypothetical protein
VPGLILVVRDQLESGNEGASDVWIHNHPRSFLYTPCLGQRRYFVFDGELECG